MVTVTDKNAREAADAANRLLGDPFLKETLDELIAINTQNAIQLPDPAAREDARQQVLAIMGLRGTLESVFQNWKQAAATLRRAKSNE